MTAQQECSSVVWRDTLYVAVPGPSAMPTREGYNIRLCRFNDVTHRWEILPYTSPLYLSWPSGLFVDIRTDRLLMTAVSIGFEEGQEDTLWELRDGSWVHLANLRLPRRGAALVGDRIVLAGGCSFDSTGLHPSRDVTAFNLRTQQFESWPTLPSAYYEGRLVRLGNDLLCLGGHENLSVAAIDTTFPTVWRVHPSSSLQSYTSGVTADRDSLYVAGGSPHPLLQHESRTVRRWTSTSGWTLLPDISDSCIVPNLLVHRNRLIRIGGQSSDLTASMSTVQYLQL